MEFLPPLSVIERLMDAQSVLARLSGDDAVARMHEELARLYREQLVRSLLG